MEIDKLLEVLNKEYPVEYVALFNTCNTIKNELSELLDIMKEDASAAMNGNHFDLVFKYNECCRILLDMQESLPVWVNQITKSEECEDRLVLVDEPDDVERVNYAQYQVDRSQPHSMDEDFTNTKICGFDFNGQTYVADSWQDALVKLDAELFKIDSKKLLSFVNDPKYKGKRVQYFVENPVGRKTKPIPGTDIYAWVNLSADQIVHLMKKLLKSYNMEEITIYLRADYSELHK